MVPAKPSTVEFLRLETIREILRSDGPCITMLLPARHAGESAGSSMSLIKTQIQSAARQLAERKLSPSEAASLLYPLEQLVFDPMIVSGSHWGRAILRSPSVFQQFHLTRPVEASLAIGGSFSIRKLVPELAFPHLFYILALSKERITLLRCADLQSEIAPLPAGVPKTVAEALELKPPDHDLENRSAVGSSTGTMHSVRFGTGSGRETQHTHLADYYKLVDRGLQKLTHERDIPLILAGLDEDVAMYRSISGYPHLVKKAILGSPDVARAQSEMLQQAFSILGDETSERHAIALRTAKEKNAPARFSTDPDAALQAAFEGRVSQLYVDESAKKIGTFARGTFRSFGAEDLLNLAAVQTILHDGEVCELRSEKMPEGAIAVAIMRF